jgi:hypothetical protein
MMLYCSDNVVVVVVVVTDWHHAVQGLESLSVIFFAIPLVVLPVYIYVALGLYYRCLIGTMALSVLLGSKYFYSFDYTE